MPKPSLSEGDAYGLPRTIIFAVLLRNLEPPEHDR
jgi:hypothetical protein